MTSTVNLPETAEGWKRLPGIGPYTAAAIASICHQEAVPRDRWERSTRFVPVV